MPYYIWYIWYTWYTWYLVYLPRLCLFRLYPITYWLHPSALPLPLPIDYGVLENRHAVG